MATTDPAVEAAQRAVAGVPSAANRSEPHRWAAAGAREALAPVRELHQAFVDYHRPRAEAGDSFSAGVLHAMRDLAFLVYTSEELQ